MTDQQRCFIETLRLINYRCFADITIPFHPKLNVLVAPNGGGKTAILEGVVVALRLFVDTMEEKSGKGFASTDVRLVLSPEKTMEPIIPVRLEARGSLLGQSIDWSRERSSSSNTSRTTTAEAQALRAIAEQLLAENQSWVLRQRSNAPLFPLVAYYGTGRLWDIGKLTEAKKVMAPNARHLGYTDSLSSSSHYKLFADWFRRFSYESKRDGSPHNAEQALSAVSNAVDTALAPSQWYGLELDFLEDVIVAQHPEYGKLPVDILSDGIRNMIGLVADIAYRAVRLNYHLGIDAVHQTPGIVLIDEVDMHLHPSWQQVVLLSLQNAFPLIQFIVTTHSPQVITTAPQENIRIIKDHYIYAAPPGTDGAESQRVLEDVFQVHPRPETPMALTLKEYLDLVEKKQWDSPRALELRQQLDEWSQDNEPSLYDADIRIANMKWEMGDEEV